MKKLLFIPILFIAILSSNAQDVKKQNHRSKQLSSAQKSPEQRAELMTKRMTEQLSLTKEQQEKVYEISLKRTALLTEQAKERQKLTKLMKEENQNNQQEIESLLTPEQQTKWTELKSKQRKLRKGKVDSTKREFKSKGGMVKKPDSLQSKRPADKIKPSQDKN